MQVRVTRSAETDLLEGFAFYEQQQAGVGDYFLDSLYADIDSLILFGGIHPKLVVVRVRRRLLSACRRTENPFHHDA